MVPIATYVFLDLETTGLPKEENNRTKITEMSLVAVKRDQVLDTRPGAVPRVLHKLTLCFNPGRPIPVSVTNVTGLSNELLEYESSFNKQVCEFINTFLNLLTKPVCLIAQNGLAFDYPIFKNHFQRMKVDLPEDLLCADSFHAFYDILEEEKKINLEACATPPQAYFKEEKAGEDLETTVVKSNETVLDQVDFLAPNTLAMKQINEATPKQTPAPSSISAPRKDGKVSKARRRFPWSEGSKPTEKYKLKDIYERVLNRPGLEAHQAENDCLMALECSVAKAKEFVKWVDENSVKFTEIKAMGF
ncbi:hypothetical protein NE865_02542 [Phthorimaea operculella]|nr:hypothetical protein NE865_02542 [Phthorimaea operculella]